MWRCAAGRWVWRERRRSLFVQRRCAQGHSAKNWPAAETRRAGLVCRWPCPLACRTGEGLPSRTPRLLRGAAWAFGCSGLPSAAERVPGRGVIGESVREQAQTAARKRPTAEAANLPSARCGAYTVYTPASALCEARAAAVRHLALAPTLCCPNLQQGQDSYFTLVLFHPGEGRVFHPGEGRGNVAPRAGLEPATRGLTVRCSTS